MLMILLSAFLGVRALGQHMVQMERCPVRTVNYEQGLMNNSIKGAITDASGFTWVSTSAGLQRFNGYALQPVTPVVAGDTISIDYPVYFLQGRQGSILIGYRNGILEYDPAVNAFHRIISAVSPGEAKYALMPLKETKEGIWCFEENKGIVIYNRDGSSNSLFPSAKNANVADLIRTEDYNVVRKLVAVNDDCIFIRTSFNEILQIDTRTHASKTLAYPGVPIIGLECNRDKIFVASEDGLAYIDIRSGKASPKYLYKQLLNDEPITRSTIDYRGGSLLLVSVEKRLFEFDTTCRCQKEITSLTRAPLLNTGFIQLVYEDGLKRIWVLTNQDIKRIEHVETPFSHFIYLKEKDNFTRAVYYDKDLNILVAGLFDGAIQLYDSSGNILLDQPVKKAGVIHILSIEKLSDDHYLVVTQALGLFVFRLSTRRISPLDLRDSPDLAREIRDNTYSNSLQREDDSTLLISTKTNVFRCRFRANRLRSAVPLLKDPPSASCFVEASDKTLWVATLSGGLVRLDPEGKVETFEVPGDYVVRCMAEDAGHRIWVGTERGLLIYSPGGKLEKSITRETGLLSDFIYALLPGNNDDCFFVSTNFGLSFVDGRGAVQNYTRELGLQENEFNTQSAARSPGGQLFFGGINGITAFRPAALSGVKDASRIVITRLVVNDSLYNLFGGAWTGETLELTHNQNRLQFDFAATGLLNPNEYLYKYRLKGFGESWQTTTQPTGIRYTLNPGQYALEIDYSPLLSPNSVSHKRLLVVVHAPWWKTDWFISLAFIGSLSLVALIVWGYNRRRYLQKIRALQLQNELQNERERISRELHDNIGTQLSYISSNVDWLLDAPSSLGKAEEKKRLSVVNDTAKNLVSDLRETIWAMKKEAIQLDELADKLKSFLQSQCIVQPQMEMTIREQIEKDHWLSPIEALNIFRICQEAIVNCIKHAQAGKISLVIQSDAAGFSFLIEDDGKGFRKDHEYTGHYGLENMKNRAAELGARLSIESGAGKGARILLSKNTANVV